MRTAILLLVLFLSLSATGQKKYVPRDVLAGEGALLSFKQQASRWTSSAPPLRTTETVYTLPVVFHIIHQNGPENLTDEAILKALDELNEGFANAGRFDQGSGINTHIRFCLAKVDPNGAATTGINHVFADFPKVIAALNDDFLKSLINWDPQRYINIWVVKEVDMRFLTESCGDEDMIMAGYATLPPAHGTMQDGIVVEAAAMPLIHEMGHYLGLLHPFEGGCENADCTLSGDGICDTPPQSKFGAPCDGSGNSCDTDAVSGFTSDQPDLPFNFMDYGQCPHNFTPGQKERMRLVIEGIRSSLLAQPVCAPQCMQPFTAAFQFPEKDYQIGDEVQFSSASTGTSFQWLVDGVTVSTSRDLRYRFTRQGWYKVELLAGDGVDGACSNRHTAWVRVYCGSKPVIAVPPYFTTQGEPVDFTSTVLPLQPGGGPVVYQWYANDTLIGNTPALTHRFSTVGEKKIQLVTTYNGCVDSSNLQLVQVFPYSDYTLSFQRIVCLPDGGRDLELTVCNRGRRPLPAGAPISFYASNPTTSAAALLAVYKLPKAIDRFCCEPVTVRLPQAAVNAAQLYGVINDEGRLPRPYSLTQLSATGIPEPNYQNNIDSIRTNRFNLLVLPADTTVLVGTTVPLTSSAPGPYTIRWTAANGSFTCDTCLQTAFEPYGYSRIVAVATDAGGCPASDTAIVKIYTTDDILIPSAFTPNADGKNDVFYVFGSKQVSSLDALRIYNRWGEKVFERRHVQPNLPEHGWNGLYKGREAAMAVYVYYVTATFADGRRKTYKGTLALIR